MLAFCLLILSPPPLILGQRDKGLEEPIVTGSDGTPLSLTTGLPPPFEEPTSSDVEKAEIQPEDVLPADPQLPSIETTTEVPKN